MSKNIFIIFLSCLFSWNGFSQTVQKDNEYKMDDINYYKYIVIPLQYDFQTEENEYLLNSLIKHLFKEAGLKTYMSVERKPNDLEFDRCLALYVDVINESESFFSLKTNLNLVLKNCKDKVVFESSGTSNIKEYKKSYPAAIKDAFGIYNNFVYRYKGNKNNTIENSSLPEKKNIDLEKNSLKHKLIGTYVLKKGEYDIKEIELGYIILDKVNGSRLAFINKTSNGNMLYNSEKINGELIITEAGDLEVEYFNKESGKLEKIVFKKQP